MLRFVIHTLVVTAALMCCRTTRAGDGQWSQLSQEELRAFTESAVQSDNPEIQPPEMTPTSFVQSGRKLVVDSGRFPKNLTDDDRFNRALDEQFQVALYRVFRNRPLMRRRWAPTLEQVEIEVREMLKVISDPNLSDNQKDQKLDAIENTIDDIYNRHFRDAAIADGLDGWEMRPFQASANTITLWTEPDGGKVKYIPALQWDLYVLAYSKNKKAPKPQWQTPTGNEIELIGKYYFYAEFGNRNSPVVGPINITKNKKTLVFTPTGLQQR